jgi:hypothetical protein
VARNPQDAAFLGTRYSAPVFAFCLLSGFGHLNTRTLNLFRASDFELACLQACQHASLQACASLLLAFFNPKSAIQNPKF